MRPVSVGLRMHTRDRALLLTNRGDIMKMLTSMPQPLFLAAMAGQAYARRDLHMTTARNERDPDSKASAVKRARAWSRIAVKNKRLALKAYEQETSGLRLMQAAPIGHA